jgi:cell division septation protein DedD
VTVPLKAARRAAGGAGAGRAAKVAPLPPAGSKAREQRDAIERIKAARPPEQPSTTGPAADGAQPASPPPSPRGGGLSVPAMPKAASTGSGFMLGVFAWAVGLAYLNGGSDGVRKFIKAKFFNQ